MDCVHPLLVQNILANIFKFFDDLNELKGFRLVCCTWNEEICLRIRKVSMVEFTSLKGLQSYTNVFKSANCVLHVNFKFNFSRDSQSPTTFTSAFYTFLEYFGKHIKSCYLPVKTIDFDASFLDLMMSNLPNVNHIGLDIQYYQQHHQVDLSSPTILNLKHVTCFSVNVQGFEITEDSTITLLTELFSYMPNLKRISCLGDIRRISKTGNFIRDLLLDEESPLKNLKTLNEWDFKTRLLQNHWESLQKTSLTLKALYADLYDPDDNDQCANAEQLANLLAKWKNTLTTLELEFPFRVALSYQFHFPVTMAALSNLYLGGFEGSLLLLLRTLPRLVVLELSQLDLASILSKPSDNDVFENVSKLTLDFCTGQSAGIITRFSRVFPQLKWFSVNHATNQVLRVIFQKMGRLTRLRIHGDELSDAGMCGMSERDLKENDFTKMSTREGQKYKKYPDIASLKGLRFLDLNAFNLTEITVRHGLVHCCSLHLVKMDCTGGCLVSDTQTVSRTFRLSDHGHHMEHFESDEAA